MKRILTLMFVFGIVLLLSIQTTNGQSPFSWEIRTGADFATQKLGDADLNTGFGFDGILSYRFMPHTAIFGGWGWHRFNSDESFAGSDVDFEETGYTFGLEYLHPLGSTQLDFYLRGGGVYNHIEVESNDGDITSDSGHGLGWQAEAGLVFDLGNGWMLKPGVRYRSLSRDIEIGSTTTETDLTTFNTSIGISRTF